MIPTIAPSREAPMSASRSRPLPPTTTSHSAPSGRKRSRSDAAPPTSRAMISPKLRSSPGSFLLTNRPNYSRDFYPAIFEALFRSESWIALVMITDLLGRKDRFNVPGPMPIPTGRGGCIPRSTNWRGRELAQLRLAATFDKAFALVRELRLVIPIRKHGKDSSQRSRRS